ncbi:MAG TPA: hypothetical protein VGO78_10890 [Acidimicrobiales bacterium]|nr:hypothetical protein [Acidimicrobiales bacterium]
MRELRWGLASAALVAIAGSLLVSLDLPDDLLFVTLVSVVAAVPFVLYAAFVVGSTASVLVGALLFVPTVTAFVAAALEIVDDRQGGAGGLLLWICLPLLALDWFVALLGVAISRSTAPRTPSTRQPQPF